jgi:hypothetical protein
VDHLEAVLEPAAGLGNISKALIRDGKKVESFDIYPHADDEVIVATRNFLSTRWDSKYKTFRERIRQRDGGVVCHPPQHLFGKFARQALRLTDLYGTTAFWLSHRIDTEYEYREFFAESVTFYKKIVPIQRLRLTDDTQEPMAWYVWRGEYGGAPQLHYEFV